MVEIGIDSDTPRPLWLTAELWDQDPASVGPAGELLCTPRGTSGGLLGSVRLSLLDSLGRITKASFKESPDSFCMRGGKKPDEQKAAAALSFSYEVTPWLQQPS